MHEINGKILTTRKYFRVETEHIGYIRFIFEGHDGIAVITTRNAETGDIVVTIAPGCEPEVDAVIQSLSSEIMIMPVNFDGNDEEIIY